MPNHPSIPAAPRNRRSARHALLVLCGAGLLAATAGCVVAPGQRGYAEVAPASVYVGPTYASPGPGYMWETHPRYGGGWRHPDRGWHRGWER